MKELMRGMPPAGTAGLTLLEIIITLVVAAILAAVMIQFVGTGVQRSSEPLQQVSGDPAMAAVMERFAEEYRSYRQQDLANESENALINLKAFIDTKANWDTVHADAGEVNATHKHIVFDTSAAPDYAETDAGNDILKVTLTRDTRSLKTHFTLR